MNSSSADHLIESKTTTQRAPLELLLTALRTRRISPHVSAGSCVLDFGCGAHLRTLRAIGSKASHRYGIDSYYKDREPFVTEDGISIAGSFADLRGMLAASKHEVDCILSLACFEHLEPGDLAGVLRELWSISSPGAVLIGTVPTPPAKPVLEFLSYKLHLIDRSQIEDHKVYYNKTTFTKALDGTGWQLADYRLFQLGMNSFFSLTKSPQEQRAP